PVRSGGLKEELPMPSVKRVEYFKMMVPNRAGQGARALDVLHKAGVNLIAFSGFPQGGGAQMDFIPAKPAAFRKVARKSRWKSGRWQRACRVSGDARGGAGSKPVGKLGERRFNVTAMDAGCSGKGRYGALLWVSPTQSPRPARARGAG